MICPEQRGYPDQRGYRDQGRGYPDQEGGGLSAAEQRPPVSPGPAAGYGSATTRAIAKAAATAPSRCGPATAGTQGLVWPGSPREGNYGPLALNAEQRPAPTKVVDQGYQPKAPRPRPARLWRRR